jgi:hypothetical protein
MPMRLQRTAKWMPVEQIPEFEVLGQHVKTFVPAKALEICGIDTMLHGGDELAALEAVPAQIPVAESSAHGAGLGNGRRGNGL